MFEKDPPPLYLTPIDSLIGEYHGDTGSDVGEKEERMILRTNHI